MAQTSQNIAGTKFMIDSYKPAIPYNTATVAFCTGYTNKDKIVTWSGAMYSL
jgi:hypothetical protein